MDKIMNQCYDEQLQQFIEQRLQNKRYIKMSLNMGYNNQNAPVPAASQSKKIFCAYHRTQFLTNFCLEKQCLMPLCPSCVAEHTQQHYQSSQKPTYVNLNQALHQVKQRCYANIVSLEQCNRKNDQLIRYREGLQQNVHDQLSECKQEIFVKIEQIFQKYETKILKQIQQKYSDNVVYESEEADTIKQYITEQIDILYEKISMLKSDQCLAALIRFYDHEQQEYEDGLKDVNQYLAKHKKLGIAFIKLGIQAMNQKLQNLCQNLLTLSYASDEQKEREEQRQNIRNSKLKKNPSTNQVTMTPTQKQKPLTTRPLGLSNNRTTPIGNFQSRSKYANY